MIKKNKIDLKLNLNDKKHGQTFIPLKIGICVTWVNENIIVSHTSTTLSLTQWYEQHINWLSIQHTWRFIPIKIGQWKTQLTNMKGKK